MHRRASLNNGWQEQTRYKYQPFDYAKIISYFDYTILKRKDTIFLNNVLDNGDPHLPAASAPFAQMGLNHDIQPNDWIELCWDVYIPCKPISNTNAAIGHCYQTVTYCQIWDGGDGGGGGPIGGGGGSGDGGSGSGGGTGGGSGDGGGDDGAPTDCPDLPIAPPMWYSQQPVLVDDCGNPIPTGGATPVNLIDENADNPSVNIIKIFNCFNLIPDAGATYSVKICVDIPVNGKPWLPVQNIGDVGHTFLSVTKQNGTQSITQSFGVLPQQLG